MIFNTTYHNTDFEIHSKELLGKSFSLLEKIKMNGAGSGRFMIAEVSENLAAAQKQFSELNYANIELRPKGILVHYTNRLQRFSWSVPYHRMVIYSTNLFSIHAEGSFIKFYKNKNYKENKKFIEKMIDFKNEYLDFEYYDR